MTDEIKSTAEEQDKTLSADIEKTSTAAEQEKTFTQAELDRIISERIARERKNLPDEADLKAYKEWKKAQQTEAEKAAEREKEYQALQSRAIELERENAVIKAGVKADDAEFVIFKVSRMEGDFKKNLDSFLSENKKFTEPVTENVPGTKHNPSTTDQDANFIAAVRRGAGLK
ncbi:MAG TPA: hypothetical protein P5519_13545 [Spirochaetia bacterium]|nr:hypothetical protein [Spirochaetia bacterium]